MSFEDALSAYDQLNNSKALGIVLAYSSEREGVENQDVFIGDHSQHHPSDAVICGFLGGGNYASRVLIPAFKKSGAQMETIVTSRGINSSIQGKKNGFNIASTSEASVV